MAVLLVLVTFLVFIALDYFLTRGKVIQAIGVKVESRPVRVGANYVDGFLVPDNVSYHSGHSWLVRERQNAVRVGADEFAAALLGRIDKVELPKRGQWIRQGQKVWSIVRNGVKVDMVSPIEGSVADINEALVNDPSLASKDCYGDGWMVTVQSPDSKTNFRNLLGGALARWWTEESSMRLQRVMPSALGALAQDGGVAIDDLASTMPDEQWTKVTREFFLT